MFKTFQHYIMNTVIILYIIIMVLNIYVHILAYICIYIWITFKHYTRINLMMDRKQRFFTNKIYGFLHAKG
jgi:hypothetical protein